MMAMLNAGVGGISGLLGNGGTTNSNTPVDVCAKEPKRMMPKPLVPHFS